MVLQELDETAQNEPKSGLAMTEVFHPSPDKPDLANKQGKTTMNASKAAVTDRYHPLDDPANPIDVDFESIVEEAIKFEIPGSKAKNDENGVLNSNIEEEKTQ